MNIYEIYLKGVRGIGTMEKRPLFVSSTYNRVDFGGGTTDLPDFAKNDPIGGSTLNAAINLKAEAKVYRVNKPGLYVVSKTRGNEFSFYLKDPSEVEGLREETKFFRELLKLAIEYGGIDSFPYGICIETDNARAPPGSGLGSSAAMGTAFLAAFLKSFNCCVSNSLSLDEKINIAEMAVQAELRGGIMCGKQDQYASVLGDINMLRFKGNRVELVDRGFVDLKKLRGGFKLFYTGISRSSGTANHDMIMNYLSNAFGVGDAFVAIRDLTEEMYKFLKEVPVDDPLFDKMFPGMLNRETDFRSILHPSIVNEDLQRIRKTAGDYGAVIKVLGAGGGGSVLIYTGKGFTREKDLEKAVLKTARENQRRRIKAGEEEGAKEEEARFIDFEFEDVGLTMERLD